MSIFSRFSTPAFLLVVSFFFFVHPVLAVGSITGELFFDTDSNGNRNGILEASAVNTTVRLWNDIDNSNTLSIGDTLASSRITNSVGVFTFSAIPDGEYVLEVFNHNQRIGISQFTTTHPMDATVIGAGVDLIPTGIHPNSLQTDGQIISTVTFNGTTPNGATTNDFDQYGRSAANMGDLDGDGNSDIFVSSFLGDVGGTNDGRAFLHFLNSAGNILSTKVFNVSTPNGASSVAPGDQYGHALANIGDLDGDGVQDVAIGALLDDTGGTNRGAFYIHYLERDGDIKSTVKITGATPNGASLADGDAYGTYIHEIGDLDDDGVQDLAVGAYLDDTGGTNRGAVYVHLMNRNGSIKATTKIASTTPNGPVIADNDAYGVAIAELGDVDGDGVEDIAVGASLSDTGGTDRGSVYIHYLNTNGTVKQTDTINAFTTNMPTLANADRFGTALAKFDDLDGDGINELASTVMLDDSGGANRGGLLILYLAADRSIKKTIEINDLTPNGAVLLDNDNYGAGVINLGDLNNDGVQDIGIGARTVDAGGTDRGSFYIHFLQANAHVELTTVGVTSTNESTLASFASIRLTGSVVAPTTIDLVITGGSASNLGVDYTYSVTTTLAIPAGNYDGTTGTALFAALPTLHDDGIAEGNETVVWTLRNPGLGVSIDDVNADSNTQNTFTLTILDDDIPTMLVTESGGSTLVSETGTTDTIQVVLGLMPTANVVIEAISASTTEGVLAPSTFTFTPGNWNVPQQVILTGVDDVIDDGDQGYALTFSVSTTLSAAEYATVLATTVNATTTDNDDPVIPTTPTVIGNGGTPLYGCVDRAALNYNKNATLQSSAYDCIYPAAQPAPQQTKPTELACSVPLYLTKPVKYGAMNEKQDVMLLEKYLNTHEGTSLPVDGIYSKTDRDAIIRWQEKYREAILSPWGLTKGTGYVYLTSLKKIKEVHERKCQKMDNKSTAPQAQRVCYRFTTNISSGMSGEKVLQMQKALKSIGYFDVNVEPNAYFGPTTLKGVIALQKQYGIQQTGTMGPLTGKKLEELSCK